MTTITIDPNYGYVLLTAASTFVLNVVHGFNTGHYRKAAQIKYPAAYAPSSRTDEAANRFNCAQRAHANYTENHTTAVVTLLLAGIRFPITSSLLGAGWVVSRYLYMRGYSTGADGGKGRYAGIYWYVFSLGLLGLTTYNGVMMILGA